ncbi:MAG: ATP-dependent nuclease [Sedimentisphaeraceae bacterium JB056]
MYISSLTIRNFRNFSCQKFEFSKGVNTIIGENGSGKTNAFFALRLLIDDSLPRSITLREGDFNRKLEEWAGHWIIISIEFSELDHSEPVLALLAQSCSDISSSEKKGRYSLYFRPKHAVRKILYDFSQGESKKKEDFTDICRKITIDDYELFFCGRGSISFEDDSDYKKYVGDFDEMEFPDPDDTLDDVLGKKTSNGLSLPSEVSCTFIKALRDVESDLRSNYKNPLLNLLKGQEKTVEPEKQKNILDQVESLNTMIAGLKEVKDIDFGVTKSLEQAIGSTYAPNIEIKSELPNEMDKLFQSLSLWVGDPDETGYKGKLNELSLGGANLIYLSLKLLEYHRVKSSNRVANFLLIEEPEAHIHTHIQKTLFSNLHDNNTQVFVSTHSTHISSVSKISSMSILSRGNKESLVFSPSKGLDGKDVTRLERYLDTARSDLLFAKGVILVEGDAEHILIPAMFEKVFGVSFDEIGVSIVNIGSTGFLNIAQIFNKERVRKQCAIITDQDKSLIPLNEDSTLDSKEEKYYRASQKAGSDRQLKFNAYHENNEYVKPFYAEYTFEVDFVKNSNEFEVKGVIDEIFKQEAKKINSKANIDNDNIPIKGKEVLKLANKIGKGWFALHVEEHLQFNTYIPEYILNAIKFTVPSVPKKTLEKMVNYRLKQYLKDGEEKDQEIASRIIQDNPEEIIDEFQDKFQDDELLCFF